jgi:uncharacterized membrane protein
MPLFFLIFGLLSVALVVTLLGSIVIGLLLQRTQRFKTFGVFVALVAPLASIGAGVLSWGLMAWSASMAEKAATNSRASGAWEVAAYRLFPIGFVVGAIGGGLLGVLLSMFIIKRRRVR